MHKIRPAESGLCIKTPAKNSARFGLQHVSVTRRRYISTTLLENRSWQQPKWPKVPEWQSADFIRHKKIFVGPPAARVRLLILLSRLLRVLSLQQSIHYTGKKKMCLFNARFTLPDARSKILEICYSEPPYRWVNSAFCGYGLFYVLGKGTMYTQKKNSPEPWRKSQTVFQTEASLFLHDAASCCPLRTVRAVIG